jgi:hypothetical protein
MGMFDSIRITRRSREYTETRTFECIRRASHWAAGQVGPTPTICSDDFGTEYAVNEGVSLTVGGAVSVRDLFSKLA